MPQINRYFVSKYTQYEALEIRSAIFPFDLSLGCEGTPALSGMGWRVSRKGPKDAKNGSALWERRGEKVSELILRANSPGKGCQSKFSRANSR